MSPQFFATQHEFRAWLELHHETEKELLVGYWKVGSGKPSMTWSESVDQALCFGWIDGIRRSIDDRSYCIRFTPRKPGSIWSAVNVAKVEALSQAGLMRPAGQRAFAHLQGDKSRIYSYEKPDADLSPDLESRFRQHPDAWDFFSAQAPSYRKAIMHWVMSAKQQTTRDSRLDTLIAACTDRKRLR